MRRGNGEAQGHSVQLQPIIARLRRCSRDTAFKLQGKAAPIACGCNGPDIVPRQLQQLACIANHHGRQELPLFPNGREAA